MNLFAGLNATFEHDILLKQRRLHHRHVTVTDTVVAAARMAELADAEASKAFTREGVWVRVPLRARGCRDWLLSGATSLPWSVLNNELFGTTPILLRGSAQAMKSKLIFLATV